MNWEARALLRSNERRVLHSKSSSDRLAIFIKALKVPTFKSWLR
jgi:hypothetical protein